MAPEVFISVSPRIVFRLLIFIASSFLCFLISYEIGRIQSSHHFCFQLFDKSRKNANTNDCLRGSYETVSKVSQLDQKNVGQFNYSCPMRIKNHIPKFSLLQTASLVQYKSLRLINVPYPEWSLLLHQHTASECQRMVHVQVSHRRQYSCLAVVYASNIESSLNQLRHEELQSTDENANDEDSKTNTNSTGFFGNVANDNGRRLLKNKMFMLLQNLPLLEANVSHRLQSHSLFPGNDVVLMVFNAGESDIFANFMCSLRRYNISSKNLVVFTSSADIVPLVEALGAIGIYHEESFAPAPRRSSYEYLDPIFIDMMWYKSFSVWLLLKMGYNVLFQDVDLVWFRDPFEYFKKFDLQYRTLLSQSNSNLKNIGIDGFFSDDGQRSLRYAPFYANSGFYYLRCNERMLNFAWGIVTSFALLHITGSHQNIFTLRLIEALDMYKFQPAMLPMADFPSGVKFSHDRPFMLAIRDGHELPYIFHMCWTKNREHKLVNFKLSSMWYVNNLASDILARFSNESLDISVDMNKLYRELSQFHGTVQPDYNSFLDLVCNDFN